MRESLTPRYLDNFTKRVNRVNIQLPQRYVTDHVAVLGDLISAVFLQLPLRFVDPTGSISLCTGTVFHNVCVLLVGCVLCLNFSPENVKTRLLCLWGSYVIFMGKLPHLCQELVRNAERYGCRLWPSFLHWTGALESFKSMKISQTQLIGGMEEITCHLRWIYVILIRVSSSESIWCSNLICSLENVWSLK